MKSMFQFIAVAVCAAVLTACGGGPKSTAVVIPPQPDYSMTEQVGTGALVAEAGDTVVIKYVGYLYDSATKGKGAKADVSESPTVTFTVGVGAVRPGWDRALLGMRAGGTRTAILPTSLTYNNASAIAARTINGVTYPAIPAYSPMVYDFEMVSVVKAVIIPSTMITDLQVGTGAEAVAGKTASVKYTGWLYDASTGGKGKQFDSNVSAATTLDIVVDTSPLQVITGFNIGVKGMKVGGKRTIVIPPYQGYGLTVKYDSAGAVTIPANSILVFDLELTAVK
ncbi:FKBP-type peptidyl-prolyl cis-trans isomerase [Duganella sp. CT11-25]|jgi:peptidylprolyl isomerase|uniref:FKBP-type peptidyl-prolyl cis-trans isomerase n=1 Tax=unclassified Duganella TaxID=2636909 RepID=UPI0039AF8A9F